MSEAPKMYTCSWCGKPTPNYREYSHPMAGILGESGYSVCDECLRMARIEREWENEQCAEERLICPYCESSIDDPWYYDEDDEEVVCPRDLAHELHDEQLLPFGVQVYCPDGGGNLRLTYDLRMQAAKSLREDSTLCLLWAMLMDSYSRWRTTGDVFSEMGESCDL